MTSLPVDLASRVRPDFPLLERQVDGRNVKYFDSAATSLTPTSVVKSIVRYYEHVGANIHRGKYVLSQEASDQVESVRQSISRLTGYLSNEVVFTANATSSMNLVAHGLPLRPGASVLMPLDAHHSAWLPWRGRAAVETIPLGPDATIDLEAYERLVRHEPSVVVINHSSNVTGFYAPVQQMATLAKQYGAVTILDASQSVGHRSVAFDDVDFLAFSGHKMLGPTGIGVLCGRYDLLDSIRPTAIGGGTVDWVDSVEHTLRKLPHRFEAGTPHIAGIFGLGAAIKYLEAIGFDALAQHDRSLGESMMRAAVKRPYLRCVGVSDGADHGAIVSISRNGLRDLNQVARILGDSYGVMCRTGHLCSQPFVDQFAGKQVLRVSGYIYNSPGEVEYVFEALDEIFESIGVSA